MHKRTRLLLSLAIPIVVILVVLAAFLVYNRASSNANSDAGTTNVTLALDWTPNTNHTGIFVAQAQGWYRQQGIHLTILPYSSNVSPDVLVSNGKADVGISSTEGVVSDAAVGQPVVSLAAIVQHNTSALVSLKSSGLTRPRDFDGKTYGAFGAPYETAVISQMIKYDGGKASFKSVTIDIDPLQALQTHRVDFVWVFEGAEVIQAKHEGMQLNVFPIVNYGIADYSTPNFIASPKVIKSDPDLLQRFMRATAQGYEYARTHPQQAAEDLISQNPKGTFPDTGYVIDSQNFLSTHYADVGHKWGVQDAASWHNYPQFIMEHDGVTNAAGKPVHNLDFNALYTNQFLF